MKRLNKLQIYQWVLFASWALFVNAINEWILGPMVKDFAVFGVFVVVMLLVLWLVSIPKAKRRSWIGFTIFSLLLGQGMSSVAYYPVHTRVGLEILMFVGLLTVVWAFTRIRILTLLAPSLAVLLANAYLPISEWPFLTHFEVVQDGRLGLVPSDMPALPFAQISTSTGSAFITLELTKPNQIALKTLTDEATKSPNALEDVLRTAKDEYRLIKISQVNGHIVQTTPTAADIAKVNPFDLVGSFFPYSSAQWVAFDNQVIQFMVPSHPPESATKLGLETATYPTNMIAFAEQTKQAEITSWQHLLNTLGVQASQPTLTIQNGYLIGQFNGHLIHVPIHGKTIISEGAFTQTGSHQVLIEGANQLQIVDLGTGSGAVVANYKTDANSPLPSDIVTGPLTLGGTNAIFVNATPAYILQVRTDGRVKTIYTAPNPSLRFEADIHFAGEATPEIITDDPSYIRNAPTRYFTSYTYRTGQLYRNWRVFRTNVVNVHPIQFTKEGTQYVAVAIYGTGQFLILKRTEWPVIPIASGLLGVWILWDLVSVFGRGGKIKMLNSAKLKVSMMSILGSVLILTGCSPSTQLLPQQLNQQGVLQSNGWKTIQAAVQLGMSENMYKIKSAVTLIQGSQHTGFSVYGSINVPDSAALSIHENNFNIAFYQQGLSAYAQDNARWSQTNAISNIGVYPVYSKLLQHIQTRSIPVYQEKDEYVVDEYCKVFRMIIPGEHVAQLSVWSSGITLPTLSQVQYTFFIGKKSGQLREVQTSSVGDLSQIGSVQVDSDTILFDIGNKIAKVQIPNDLVKTLES